MQKVALTPYQRTLFKPISLEKNLYKIFAASLIILLSAGYLAEYNGILPSFLYGWLIFFTILVIALNWFGVVVGLVLRSLLWGMGAVYNLTHEESQNEPWSDESKKLALNSRKAIIDIAKISIPYSVNLSFSGVCVLFDLIADWLLFAVLITTNHPILGIFHGTALALQYLVLHICKKKLFSLVALLDDPLEVESDVDIDALIDKLCEPER